MATGLVKAGYEVTVWNRSPTKPVEGTHAASTRRTQPGRGGGLACVSDTAAVEQVMFGLRGAFNSLTEGAVVADSSTISPAATLKFAERVRERGADWVITLRQKRANRLIYRRRPG